MSDGYDRDGQEEFQFSRAPDFNQMMGQRLSNPTKPVEAKSTTGFDPYKVMVKKKEADDGKPIDTSDSVKWPAEDIKVLEDFCQKHGIVGFNCGKMSPLAALAMLKNMMGIADGPLENRVPPGYEKLGTKNPYNPSSPYQMNIQKKSLLRG